MISSIKSLTKTAFSKQSCVISRNLRLKCTRRRLATTSNILSDPIIHANAHVRGNYGCYGDEYAKSMQDPKSFWLEKAKDITWFKEPTIAYNQDPNNSHIYNWFPDGIMNTCYNCLDVHCENGRADQIAIYYDSPVTNTKRQIKYKELLDDVSKFACALQNLGIEKGDRIVIYMPMIPESIIAMLACVRIGAIHSVVFGGFASKELAKRIQDCQPKITITADAGIEPTHIVPYKPLLDKALEIANVNSHKYSIVVQRPNLKQDVECKMGSKDLDYEELISKSSPVDAVPLSSNHLHYILYTSGTTGIPKGVVRDVGPWAVALKYAMNAFYDNGPGQVMWTASDIGWVVGHSFIVYAPLLNGSSTVLYEGKPIGTPDAGAFWRVMSEYGVRTFFTAPTAFRAIKQADPKAELAQKYDLSSLNGVYVAGEHCDPATLSFIERALETAKPDVRAAIDHWWQTEVTPAVGNALGLGRMPVKPGACSAPAPGFDVHVVGNDGRELPRGELGEMVIRTPLPPGTLRSLYNNDNRYVTEYLGRFPGYYDTGDCAMIDDDGYIYIMGRTDDLIMTAGHRISTGAIEELLQSHPAVAECAVIPVKDELKGEIPVGFVITYKGSTIDHEILSKELIQIVRDDLGPVASFKKVGVVTALPKTRSGKILRSTMAKIANGEKYTITPTIEDPKVFDYLEPIIKSVVSK